MNHLVAAGKEPSLRTRVSVAPLPHYPKLALQFSSLCGWSSRIREPNKTCTLWAEGVHSLVNGGLLLYLGKYTLLKIPRLFCLTELCLCSLFSSLFVTTKCLNPKCICNRHFGGPIIQLFFHNPFYSSFYFPRHPSLSVFLLADLTWPAYRSTPAPPFITHGQNVTLTLSNKLQSEGDRE